MTTTLSSPAPTPALLAPFCPSPYRYQRRRTHVVTVGNVAVGGDNPIRVQSMTTTQTLDTDATVAQAERLVAAGCEIVRITAPTVKAARNLAEIKRRLRAKGIDVPLVADIHFSPEAALEAAEHVEKVRINPGNYADSRKFAVREYSDAEYAAELERIEQRFAPLVRKCKERGIAMRIGTNHGSLSDRIVNRFGDTPEGMVASALEFVLIAEKYGYDDIILSMKASNPKVMIAAYRLLAARMGALGMTYPFHLGVTEAGNGEDARLKSAIGIGSLLADGIGDTIRVSLAEEPEEEIPVARALAGGTSPRTHLRRVPAPRRGEGNGDARSVAVPLSRGRGDRGEVPWDPFHFERRASRETRLGPITLGGEQPVAVVSRVGADGAAQVLRWASPGARRLARPEVAEWPVRDEHDLAALQHLRARLDAARVLTLLPTAGQASLPRFSLLATGSDPRLLERALPSVDGLLWQAPSLSGALDLSRAVTASGKTLWLEAFVGSVPGRSDDDSRDEAVAQLLAVVAACRASGLRDLVLAISADATVEGIHAQRLLTARLAEMGDATPLFLRSGIEPRPLLQTACGLGSLLCDGIGDAVQASTGEGGQEDVRLTLNVLQNAGTRLSKTDYVACPSCGRTLFDLQSTTDRIKAKTAHLVGVKIAIMGCVVNGPGEMADADFGYVGGSPGHVNLYVGKTCVEKGVPAEEADERLIALIKAHGRWQEQAPDDEVSGSI